MDAESCCRGCLLLLLKSHCLGHLQLLIGLVSGRVDGQGLRKVRLLCSALRTGHHLRVVGEKIEWLLGMAHQLATGVALESFLTARHSSKDVIGIHCSKYKVPSCPRLEAVPADDSVASPTLQTGHANSCHVAGLSLAFDLDAGV